MGDAQSTEDHGFAILEIKYASRDEPIWARVPLGIDLADGTTFTMAELVTAVNEMMEEGNESFIQLTHIPPGGSELAMFLRAKNIDFIVISREDLNAS